MNWIPAAIAAIATIVGVLIGGWLNHQSAIRAISSTAQTRETAAAYVDYVDGVAGLAQAQRVTAQVQRVIAQARSAGTEPPARLLQQENEALSQVTAALSQIAASEARIVVYGHPDVIAAMAEFRKEGARIEPGTYGVFASIMFEMRKHITNESRLDHSIKEDIKIMIFGLHDRDD